MTSGHLDQYVLLAHGACEPIILCIRGNGRHRNFRFVANPTTGALEIPSDLRAEMAGGLKADTSRVQLRLYLPLLQFYLGKFRLLLLGALHDVDGYLKSRLLHLRCW